MQEDSKPTYIRRIEISKLFGYLTYAIPRDDPTSTDFSRLMMLYGDNGCGKTTILSLLFALLAPQLRAGHRGYIRRTPFKRFTIYFDDGASVSAEKKAELVGAYSVCVAQNQSERTYHLTTDARGIIEETPDLLSLVQHLRRFSPAIYFLPDDRRVRSTLDDDGENPDELSPVRAPYRYERYPWRATLFIF